MKQFILKTPNYIDNLMNFVILVAQEHNHIDISYFVYENTTENLIVFESL